MNDLTENQAAAILAVCHEDDDNGAQLDIECALISEHGRRVSCGDLD